MSRLRIAIVGCTGRMGQTLVRLATVDPALELVAGVTVDDDPRLGDDVGSLAGLDELGLAVTTNIPVECDAVIEFSSPAGCMTWAAWCAARGIPLVSGTTGLADIHLAELRTAAQRIPILWAPNMSTGINLLLALVQDLATKLDENWDIEIVETHHRRKVDAPSGTAKALLEAAAAGRQRRVTDVAVYGRGAETGPRSAGQIGVHALRMGSIVGEHEVHFTSEAESLTLTHRAFSRETFAAGALRAAQWIVTRPPGLYAMRDVLFAQ